MAEVNTFSALLDDAGRRTGRPQAIDGDLVTFARLTIRECQEQAMAFFDLVEDVLTVDIVPYIWAHPQYFREIKAVKYPGILTARGQPIYPKHLQPGERQERHDHYYYYTGRAVAFSGLSIGQTVQVAYLKWAPKLPYYNVADRPATFDLQTGTWAYLSATTDEEKTVARDQVTNWLLEDWYDTILEGACAKMWKAIGDPRAGSTFGLYMRLQKGLVREVSNLSFSAATN